MQECKFIKEISPSVKIICLILLVISILIAKSIYLILFIMTFNFIICVLSSKKVNLYVKFIKNRVPILLILTLAYIIIMRECNLLNIVLIVIKLLIILILIKNFEFNIDFNNIHSGLYKLISPLKKRNVKELTYNISLALYFINYILDAKEHIKSMQVFNGRRSFRLRSYFEAKLVFAANKLTNLDSRLKLSHYNMQVLKNNFVSNAILIVIVIFFAVCVFKEVLL